MKKFPCLFIIMLLWSAYACHDDIKFSHLGCCETAFIADSIGHATVFVPNVFTPNGDGLNDRFYVLGDSIRQILNFEIRDKFNKTVYQASDYAYPGIEYGWDGKVNGVVQKGLYGVYITLETLEGIIGNYEGSVCNFPCGPENAGDKISSTGCHFASEWECWKLIDGCQIFENLDCFE